MRLCRVDGAVLPGLRQDAETFSAARLGAESADLVRASDHGLPAGPGLLPARAALPAPYGDVAGRRRGRAVPALRRLCRDEAARLPALADLRRLGQPYAFHHLCVDRVDGDFKMATRQLAPRGTERGVR